MDSTVVRGRASRPHSDLGPGCVALGSDLLDAAGLAVGDVAQLSTRYGTAYATLSKAPRRANPEAIHLGSMLWSVLQVRLSEHVEVRSCPTLPEAKSIAVRTAFSLGHDLEERLTDWISASRQPVWVSAKLLANVLPGGSAITLAIETTDPTPSRTGSRTEVTFLEPDPKAGERRPGLGDVGGLDTVIGALREFVELPLLSPWVYRRLGIKAPTGVLLHGPPGTGKTLTCRALAEELGVTDFSVSAGDICGDFTAETERNLRNLFSEAAHHAPSVIIFDEVDVVAGHRDRLASHGDVRTVSQLLTLMDGLRHVEGVVVLGTTNRPEAIDPAFRRPGRFDAELRMPLPSAQGRREILGIHTREMPLTQLAVKEIERVAEATHGHTGADLMDLARRAGLAAARRVSVEDGVANMADLTVDARDWLVAMERRSPSALRGLDETNGHPRWTDVDGLRAEKEALLAAAEPALSLDPVGRVQGAVLFGKPGNGKSLLALALAEQVGANLVLMERAKVFHQYLGESEEALRSLFRLAADSRPSVLILDHVETLAPSRARSSRDSASERIFGSLLASIDDVLGVGGVFILGITTAIHDVDPMILRPGRLGAHIEIGDPDRDRRTDLIMRALGPDVLGGPEALIGNVAKLVDESDGMSAAETEALARLG